MFGAYLTSSASLSSTGALRCCLRFGLFVISSRQPCFNFGRLCSNSGFVFSGLVCIAQHPKEAWALKYSGWASPRPCIQDTLDQSTVAVWPRRAVLKQRIRQSRLWRNREAFGRKLGATTHRGTMVWKAASVGRAAVTTADSWSVRGKRKSHARRRPQGQGAHSGQNQWRFPQYKTTAFCPPTPVYPNLNSARFPPLLRASRVTFCVLAHGPVPLAWGPSQALSRGAM